MENGDRLLAAWAAAGDEIIAKTAGTTSTIDTELQAGVNPKLREEYFRLRKEIKPMEESLDQLQKGLARLRSIDQNLLPPDKKEMMLKLTRAQFSAMGQVETARKRLCELESALEELRGGQVRISDYVYPGVKIVIGSLVKPVQETARYNHLLCRCWRHKNSSVQIILSDSYSGFGPKPQKAW